MIEIKYGYVERAFRAEEIRIEQLHAKKSEKGNSLFNDCQDDRFAFIAGYTSGGAPYGTTWEELGCSPHDYEDELAEELAALEDELDEIETGAIFE